MNPLEKFTKNNVTRALSEIEKSIHGLSLETSYSFLDNISANSEALVMAGEIKRLSSQIDVIIHSLGILLCLPHILEPGERVEYTSLGAGNTGRKFDLETNYRIAEFKFINWQGGPESIRQNSTFKDFFELSEANTKKRRCLYLLGTEHPLKFFNGGRAIRSVLSRNDRIKSLFESLHGENYSKVSEYYQDHKHKVEIVDVSEWVSDLLV